MPQYELAWAAGFYDGEGSTSINSGKKPGRKYLRASVGQKELQPLDRFAEAVGQLGNVRGPYAGMGNVYRWEANSKAAFDATTKLWPFLSEPKRAQWKRAIAVIYEYRKDRVKR